MLSHLALVIRPKPYVYITQLLLGELSNIKKGIGPSP